jgi:hypothetical protein
MLDTPLVQWTLCMIFSLFKLLFLGPFAPIFYLSKKINFLLFTGNETETNHGRSNTVQIKKGRKKVLEIINYVRNN